MKRETRDGLLAWLAVLAALFYVVGEHMTEARQDRNIDKLLAAATQAGWTV